MPSPRKTAIKTARPAPGKAKVQTKAKHSNGVKAKPSIAAKLKPAIAAKLKAAVKSLKPTKATKSAKRIYFFGGGKADGNKDMKNLLGGKGANLAEMTNIGVPVPPGFTITTEVCTEFYKAGRKLPRSL